MPIEHAVAMELSTELIQLVKKIEAIRHHSPRVHPGIEPSSYPVLFALRHGPARVSALADLVHSDVSTVSRQVSNLVCHELVAKVSDPDDGRAQRVALTDEGAALVQRLQDGRGRWFQQILSDWDDEKARAFTRHLHEFIGDLTAEIDRARSQGADFPEFPPTPRKDHS